MCFWLLMLFSAFAEPTVPGSSPSAPTTTAPPVQANNDLCDRFRLPDGAEQQSIADEYQLAVEAYRYGCHATSLALFTHLSKRIDEGEVSDITTFQEIHIYLGELLFMTGNRQAAFSTFESLLRKHPDTQIGVLEHDPEAVKFFEVVKSTVENTQAPPPPPFVPPPIPRLPVAGYMPFGVPQFSQKRPAAGIVFASLQASFAAISVGTYIHLTKKFDKPYSQREVSQATQLRFLVQWPASFGFWASYLASHMDARRHWKKANGPQLTVTVDPTNSTLLVAGQF